MEYKVLLVEDNPLSQKTVKSLLERIVGKNHVDVASHAEAAYSHLDYEEYSAYIIDGRFPRMFADLGEEEEELWYSIVRHIEEDRHIENPKDRIYIFSGTEEVVEQAKKMGYTAYLKPSGLIEIFKEIKEKLDNTK